MSDTPPVVPPRIFDSADAGKNVVLPWNRTVGMCWSNVSNRMGRSFLTFSLIVIVVTFLMSTLSYQNLLTWLIDQDDVTIRAHLERAGVVAADPADVAAQADRRKWLLGLSGLLCLVGITNTMLMSVTERYREIGTLKCLGALDRFIVRLFLIESFFIGLLASFLGSFFGYVLGVIQMGALLKFSLVDFNQYLATIMECAPMAMGAGTILTVLASIYPTYVAAQMKPVDAMRSEI